MALNLAIFPERPIIDAGKDSDKVNDLPKKSPENHSSWFSGVLYALAERVGFEPTVPCSTPDFESGTFDPSATSPLGGGF